MTRPTIANSHSPEPDQNHSRLHITDADEEPDEEPDEPSFPEPVARINIPLPPDPGRTMMVWRNKGVGRIPTRGPMFNTHGVKDEL